MLATTRLLTLALLGLCMGLAPAASAGVQLYQASWTAESFGNHKVGGTGASAYFSHFGMPQGILCNPLAPICSFSSTPVNVTTATKTKQFNPLGPYCAPITLPFWGQPSRPAKDGTATTGGKNMRPIPPLYRNPFFFTAGGAPKVTGCTAYTTIGGANATQVLTTNDPLRGIVMKGNPVSGDGKAQTVTPGPGGAFTFQAAPATAFPYGTKGIAGGFRRTTLGEFNNIPPYLYSYTYAQARNDAGSFKAGGGFFTTGATATTASIAYALGGGTIVANASVKKGPNNFGGTMKMLGKVTTTKVCFYSLNQCFLGENWWRYDAIGASGLYTSKGVVTLGQMATYTQFYYATGGMQISTVYVSGSRFPWTTGSVTLSATGRGPHKTYHVRKGYDNRTSVSGKGTIQLVSPILTRWLTPGPTEDFETGGIAVMRIQFLPEPQKWAMLVAGFALLGVAYRMRRR